MEGEREARLEEAEQDIRTAMHTVDPYGSLIDGVGYTDQQNLEDGDKALDWLLSEIDRLREIEEAASGLVDEGARLVDVGDSVLGCDYCGAAILNGQLRHEGWCDWARLKAKLEGEDEQR